MGRKKLDEPKTERIRITRADKTKLDNLKIAYNLPTKFTTGDVVGELIRMVKNKDYEK